MSPTRLGSFQVGNLANSSISAPQLMLAVAVLGLPVSLAAGGECFPVGVRVVTGGDRVDDQVVHDSLDYRQVVIRLAADPKIV
jgi:hypothetical protein